VVFFQLRVVKQLHWDRFKPFGFNYYYGPLGRSFFSHVWEHAVYVLLIFVATIVVLGYLKKWKLLVAAFGAIIALYTLVMIAFEEFDGSHVYDHYYEQYVQPCLFFLVLAFSIALVSLRIDIRIKAAAIAVILIGSFVNINDHSEWYERRQNWQYNFLGLMDRLHLKKAIVGRNWGPDGIVPGTFWSSSTETLFLSSLEGPEHSKTLFMAWNINEVHEPYNMPDVFLLDGSSFRQSTLPSRYFRLGDKPFVILEQVLPDSVLEQTRSTKYQK
jgi:hypothetical protein